MKHLFILNISAALIVCTSPAPCWSKPKEVATRKVAPVSKVGKAQKAPTPLATIAPAITATSVPSQPKDPLNLAGPDLDLSKEPTNISANSLTLLNDKRIFTYEGKVIVTQGDLTLLSDFLDGTYSEKNEIQKITARSNVDITKGAEMKAKSQRAEYNAVDRTIVLTETPSVEQNGSILTADLIKIFIDENRSVAEGNVKVTLKNTGDGLKPAAVKPTSTEPASMENK